MVGLIDIAPAVETVNIGGKQVSVPGISAKGIAHLLARFPELRKMMSRVEVSEERLFEIGGDVIGAIIAAGCGYPGDEKAEAMATNLPAQTQADLLAKILKVTMPDGIGPFVEKLMALGMVVGVQEASSTAPDTTSEQQSAA
jgi:hypothetical protein